MRVRHIMGTLATALVILVSGSVSMTTAQAPSLGHLRVLSSDEQGILLELTVADLQIETVTYEGQTYHRLMIPDMVQTDTPGFPQVPTRGALLGLPGLTDVAVEMLESNYETLSGYRLLPLPPSERVGVRGDPLPDVFPHGERIGIKGDALPDAPFPEGDAQQTLPPDEKLCTTNAFYPGQTVEIGYTGYLRDQAVAQVQFYPVQYNPVTAEVRLYRRILARITWDTALSTATTAGRAASPAYEHVLKHTILNYDALERPTVADSTPNAGPVLAQASAATSSTAPTLKIGVIQDGLYQLTYADLTDAGFDLSGVDPRTIKISNRNTDIPILVQGEDDGTFNPSDVVLFYGTAITDIYTTRNMYWLEAGGSNGRRMSTRDGTPSGSATVPVDFPVTLHAEEDTHYWLMKGGDSQEDHWFWYDRLGNATGLPAYRDYTLSLDNISTGASTATIRVRLKGFTAGNHRTKLYLNDLTSGHEIDDRTWSGQIIYDHEVTVPHASLRNGDNVVRVQAIDYDGQQSFVNWIEVEYWDTYVAESDELLFGAPAFGTFQFEVSRFSDNQVQVFDVTDSANVSTIINTVIVDDGGSYKLRFEDTAQPTTHYLALTPAQRKSPASIELDQPSDWRSSSNGADYIIITPENFYASTLPLAGHRAATGLRAVTAKIEDIYDEFNYGISNPQAVRDFLSYAYHNWESPAPTYVLLISGATYDYRDLHHLGRVNYVPTHLTVTPLLGETPSDNWFVSVSGEDPLPDMFIGRLTAQTSAEVADMVSKIIHYEENPPDGSWNTDVLLVADDGNPPGDNDPTFEIISEALANRLPYYYTAHKVYLLSGDPPNPTADIANGINNGSLLVNYAGHGNRDFWAQEHIFDLNDVTALNNMNKPPVVSVANCLNGYFVGSGPSMAEKFIERGNKGAVAVWADTSLGYPTGHQTILQKFYDAIFQDDHYALGAATTAAKIATYELSSDWGELVETFVLFGDPATTLGLPTNYPYIESTTPVNSARDVQLDQSIHVVFSKPMDPATVHLSGPGAAGLGLTPTWSANNTVLNYAHTGFDYNQVLTFTISGEDRMGNTLGPGPVPSTWSFTTPFAPDDVDVSGPATGGVQVSYTFNAAVSPSLATQPITYAWQATDQAPVTHTGRGLNDSASFDWSTPGTKTVTVTASNTAGQATGNYVVTIYVPPSSVEIAGSTTGATNTTYTFSAAVDPGSTSQPLTYIWQATDQAPVTHTGRSLNDSVTFNWSTPGTKTVTVNVSNPGGTATDTYQVTIKVPPGEVTIAGPQMGVVQVGYAFTAAVSPANATPPFTYTWQATGQKSVTHTGNSLKDTVNFNWDAPGTKSITVTVINDVGRAVSTDEVTLDYSPPTHVKVTGPTKGAASIPYTFAATISPITTTRPITYIWQATGQVPVTHTGGDLSDSVTFTWDMLGSQIITVTATNAGGTAVQTHGMTIMPISVDITGPAMGIVQASYTYTATLNPPTAAQPVTYVWLATDQAPVTHADRGLEDTITFNWDTPGTKTIEIAATNAEGTFTNTYQIVLSYAPPTRVTVTGPVTGTVDSDHTFTAAVSPVTATQPITYVWQATDQAPVTHTGRALNDAMTFTWAMTGTHIITVTAGNAGGTAYDTHSVTIGDVSETRVYLPLVIR